MNKNIVGLVVAFLMLVASLIAAYFYTVNNPLPGPVGNPEPARGEISTENEQNPSENTAQQKAAVVAEADSSQIVAGEKYKGVYDNNFDYYFQINGDIKIAFQYLGDWDADNTADKWAGEAVLEKRGEKYVLLKDISIVGPGGHDFTVLATNNPDILLLRRSDGDMGAWSRDDYYLGLSQNKIIFQVATDSSNKITVRRGDAPAAVLGLALVDNCANGEQKKEGKARVTDLTLDGKPLNILKEPIEIDCAESVFGRLADINLEITKIKNDFSRLDFELEGRAFYLAADSGGQFKVYSETTDREKESLVPVDESDCQKYTLATEKYLCYTKIAVNKKDLAFCGLIPQTAVINSEPDVVVKDSCIAEVAKAALDQSVCAKTSAPDSITTALCYYEIAIATKDVSICAKVSHKADGYGASIASPRDDCYLNIAVARQNVSICENTSVNSANHLSSSDRSNCYFQVAVAKKDASICDKITPDMIQNYSGSEDTTKAACRAAVLKKQACEGLPIPKVDGLTYHKARIEIIKSGWQPLQTNSNDSELSGQARNFFNAEYKEVEDCAGTGKAYCRFLFKDSCSNIIKVVTAGEEIPELNAFAAVEGIAVMTDKEKSSLGL